jgi:hypothetical protein
LLDDAGDFALASGSRPPPDVSGKTLHEIDDAWRRWKNKNGPAANCRTRRVGGAAPAPLAVGIDLGTTNSLVATVRSGMAVCLPDDQGAPAAVRGALPRRRPTEVGYDAQTTRRSIPRTRSFRSSASWGGAQGRRPRRTMPYDFVEAPGMVKLKTVPASRARSKSRPKS